MGNSKQGIVRLVIGSVVFLIIVATVGFSQWREAQENASYTNGNYYLDFNPEVSEVGVSSEGFITCGADSGNFAHCGESRWLGYDVILRLAPLLVAVSILLNATVFYLSLGKNGTNPSAIIYASVVVPLLFSGFIMLMLNVMDGWLVDAVVKSAMDYNSMNLIGLFKRIPTILATIFVVFPILPPLLFIFTGSGSKRNTGWQGY